jgi:hypothetical protein
MAGAVAVVVGSFAPFYSFSVGGVSASVDAWNRGLSPISLYPMFAAGVSGAVIALRRFANVGFSGRVGSFTWDQVHLLLGLLATLVAAGYFFSSSSGELSYGFWLILGGSIATLVGAILLPRDRRGPYGLP